MIRRTELERTRRAAVVGDAIAGLKVCNESCLAVVDALDLLDNEDEAGFKTLPDPAIDDLGLTPPGRRIRDPHEPTRKLPEARHSESGPKLPPYLQKLQDANEAEQSDWTFFKGCLLGLAVALALYGGISWGLMYYG